MQHQEAIAKIERLAYQIYEKNWNKSLFAIAGIADRGFKIAQLVAQKLEEISNAKVLCLNIHKNEYHFELPSEFDPKSLDGIVILVDDVLYTGKTMLQACTSIAQLNLPAFQIAVLIDRGHRNFPISADFVGLNLATTLQEYVIVEINEVGEIEAFLE